MAANLTNASSASARGSCLCSAVRFTAPLPPNWVAHCHCSRCQRAHGAAFVTWVGVDAARAVIDDPQGRLRWYRAEPDTGGERGFCAHCGSPMFFRGARWPGELHIARALFTESIGAEPQGHAYYDTHVDWVALGDILPRSAAPESPA